MRWIILGAKNRGDRGQRVHKMATLGPRPKDLAKLKRISAPHLDSFNYFLKEGMHQAVADLDPIEIEHNNHRLHGTERLQVPQSPPNLLYLPTPVSPMNNILYDIGNIILE